MDKEAIKQRIRYEQPLQDDAHQNHLWYGGDVCSVEYKGVLFTLCANGDVFSVFQSEAGEYIEVRDKSNHAVFAEKMRNVIPSDEMLEKCIKNTVTLDLPSLDLMDANWWEVFMSKDGKQYGSFVLDSEKLSDAIDEMSELFDFWIKENDLDQKVYVYHEYKDSEAYGTQTIMVFHERNDGLAHLRKCVEEQFGMSLEDLQASVDEDEESLDTVEEDYVSIDDGSGCSFFILEEATIQ